MSQDWFIFHLPDQQKFRRILTLSVSEDVRKLLLLHIVQGVGKLILTFGKLFEIKAV